MTLSPGTRLGPYEVTAQIGVGGMGQVYRARDLRLSRDVAIKILSGSFTADRERLARFEREAGLLAALNHPNICTLYDIGPNYLVTELVEGETLYDWLGRRPSMPRRLESARQILEALGAAHRAGIVHRDLKPVNIMVRFDGYVKVLDFGLAKRVALEPAQETTTAVVDVTLPGYILGTVGYMSPEQIRGEDIDQRSDLFAFGVVLYEMLTGHRPWPNREVVDVLHAILHDDPPMREVAESVGVEFASILERLLRKSPTDRYQTAEAVLEALAAGFASPESSPLARAGPTSLTSIAVLPFLFLSGVEDQQSLSLGFADALITLLSKLEDVAVAPTSTILRCAPGANPARVCGELGVRYALQGNVQKLGAQWRVSIQLFDATTERVVFSEKHDFTRESAFEVQDEIGQRVVDALHSRFPPGAPRTRERYSSDPEAYEMFMAGYRESFANDPEMLRSAAQHLSASLQLDPKFALAHATLSHVTMILHFSFDPQHHWLEMAEDHCQRAVTLDPMLPEGHLARAWILWSPAKNFQHAEAIAALERALAIQPNLERAHNRMSTICAHIGRLEEARMADERARRSNPKTQTGNLDTYYFWIGDFKRAGAQFETEFGTLLETRSREERAPAYAHLAYSARPLYLGELELAEERLTLALRQHPQEPLLVSLQGMLHARCNRRVPALECVNRALESPRSFGHTHHTHYHIACVYAMLADTNKAMEWLEHCAVTGFPCWPFFRVDPHLENVRHDPRFTRLVTDLERKYTALEIHSL